MLTEKLKEAVRQEAIFLRSFATQEQRDKIDFMELNPWDAQTCIYGQMTGNCYGEEAASLFAKCAAPYSAGIYQEFANGEPPEPTATCFDENGEARRAMNHSAIEYYISLPENEYSLKNLTDFLQKKTDKLIL